MLRKILKIMVVILYTITMLIAIWGIFINETYSFGYEMFAVLLIIIANICACSLLVCNNETEKMEIIEMLGKNGIEDNKSYTFYIDGCCINFYNDVINGKIDIAEYKKREEYILRFTNKLFTMSRVLGLVTDTHKNKKALYGCKDYKNQITSLKKKGMVNKKCYISPKFAEVATIYGTRGLGKVIYIFEDIGVIMGISNLQGFLRFENEENTKKVLILAERCGIIVENNVIE